MRCRGESGFSLVEVMIAMMILSVGILGLIAAFTPSIRLSNTSHETTVAMNAARQMIETLDRSWGFDEIFALYNEDPADDPGGAGTGPGQHFTIEDLSVQPGDPDGCVGRIVFPVSATGALREDIVDPELGMPRDLDGVAGIDAGDHSGDYIILPITIIMEWQGASGLRSAEVRTLLTGK